MKKRLLSMLLLVAMIVTALPIVALPAFAAEEGEKEYAAGEYNALYVQKGLLYAIDFFATNTYWGGASATYTDNTSYKAALLTYEWATTAGITWATLSSGTVTVGNGYIDLSSAANDISIGGVATATGYGFASGGGATAEYLQQGIGGGMMFNNLRIYFNATSHVLRDIQVQSDSYRMVNSPLFNGTSVKTNFFTYPATMTIAMSVNDPTYSRSWGDTTLGAYTAVSGKTTASNNHNGYVGEWIEVEGEEAPVLSIAAEATQFIPFFHAGARVVEKVEYQAGEKLETPLENVLVYFPADQTIGGSFALYENGKTLYENAEASYLNNAAAYDSAFIKWSSCTGNIYAVRYYNRTLTAAEAAQNHFADLAKWFRLDLSRFEGIADEKLAALYAVAADYNLTSDRAALSAAVYETADALVEESYTEKYEGTVDAAIFAVAKEYLLDLDPLIGVPRGVLPSTYALLLGDLSGVSDVPAAYEAAIAADLAAYAASSSLELGDYNTLYVQDGALLMADYYRYNSIWGETPALPASPITITAYEYEGKTYDFTKNEGCLDYTVTYKIGSAAAVTLGTYDTEALANAAVEAKKAEGGDLATATYTVVPKFGAAFDKARSAYIGEVMKFFEANAYVTKMGALRPELPSVGTENWKDKTAKNQVVPFTVADGYLQMTNAYGSSSYLNLSSLPHKAPVLTGEYVMATGPVTGDVGILTLLRDVGLAGTVSLGELTLAGVGNYGNGAGPVLWEKPYILPVTQEQTFTLGMQSHFGADEKSYDVTVFANGNMAAAEQNYADKNLNSGASTLYYQAKTHTQIYAYRFYERDLTAAEMAQNHFADVCKFFRLNLATYMPLSATQKEAVHAALADIDLGETTRYEAQAALLRATAPYTKEAYDAMKVPGNDALNAFLDVAADYSLDVKAVMSSDRDMSTVYAAVTAEALTGKSAVEAQAILDEAVFDAYHYLSYCVDPEKAGAESWNAQLVRCAAICDTENNVDLEGLMVLPWSLRSQVTVPFDSYEAAQTYVDAFVADALAAYGADGYVDYDYDSLYVQEGLAFALDFFKTNSYWNTDGVTYTAPVGPAENTAFEYEGKTYDLTKTENRYGWGLVKSNAWVDDTVYATKAEAEAAAAALGDSAVTVNERVTPVFEAAWNAWMKADRAYLMSFTTKGNFALFSYQPNFAAKNTASYNIASYNTAKSFSVFTHGDGFIEIRNGIHTSGGLQLRGANDVATDNVSLQVTTAFNVPANAGAKTFMILHNIRPTYTSTANSLSFHSVATNNFTISGSLDSKNTLPNTHNTAISLTVTLEGLLDADADDAVVIRTPASEIASASGALVRNSASDTNYFSYGGAPAGQRIYAIRYYNEALTEADLAQNHFADLAKFFRLDLSLYALMDDALRAELHEAFLAYDIASADRAELSATLSAVGAKLFDGMTLVEDEEANATFLTMAAAGALDLDRIVNLGAEAKASVVEAMLDEFLPCYVLNGVIVGTVYDELTLSLGAMTFAGYQVRIDTGVAAANYAGVRAVFDIDKAIVAELLKATDEVVLTVNVAAVGGGTATLTVTCTQGDGDVAIAATLKVGDAEAIPATVYERELADGSKTLSVNYTVTYKGEAFTKANLTQELAYSYAIKAGAASYDFAVTSERFGDTVTAAEVYAAFAAMDRYESDPVVTSVLAATND